MSASRLLSDSALGRRVLEEFEHAGEDAAARRTFALRALIVPVAQP